MTDTGPTRQSPPSAKRPTTSKLEIVLTPTDPNQAAFDSWVGVSNEIVAKLSAASRYGSANEPVKADADRVVTEWSQMVEQGRPSPEIANTYATDLESLAAACHLPPLARTQPRPS